jgi:hypothetical protein
MRIITRDLMAREMAENLPIGSIVAEEASHRLFRCDECGQKQTEAMIEINPPWETALPVRICMNCGEKIGEKVGEFRGRMVVWPAQ